MRAANLPLLLAGLTSSVLGCNVILGLGDFTNCKGGDVDASADCASGGGGSGHGGATTNGGGGGATACEPRTTKVCYDAKDKSTEGQGVCHGGTQTCSEDGQGYGECTGEVTPTTEDCTQKGNEGCTGEFGCSDLEWAVFGQSAHATTGGPIAIDKDGNVIAIGGKSKAVTWGGTVLPAGTGTWIVKISPKGKVLWAKSSECGDNLALDADGNIFVQGFFIDSCDFDGKMLTFAEGNTPAMAVARIDADGALRWAEAFGYVNFRIELAVDSHGDVVLAGGVGDKITLGAKTVTGAGSLFVARLLGSNGQVDWADGYTPTGTNAKFGPYALALDSQDRILVGGSLSGAVDFEGMAPLDSAGTGDGFVVQLDSTGKGLWSHNLLGLSGGSAAVLSLATDSHDNVLMGVTLDGTLRLGGFDLTSTGAISVVGKLSSGGNAVWMKPFGPTTGSTSS